jgi:hypothetical protein
MNQAQRDRINSAVARALGEAITYIPGKGGDPVETKVLLRAQANPAGQPSAPGFFADVEVLDRTAIASPAMKDKVVWADGKVYVVGLVRERPGHNLILSLQVAKGNA